MNKNTNKIKKHIDLLETEIHELEKRLAAMIWERNKYVEFSKDSTKIKNIR